MRNLIPHMVSNGVVERVRTNSILNPLLWLCGITELFCVPAACASDGYAKTVFITIAALPVLFSIIAYFIWMFRDPNRLQSEDYQLAQQKLIQGTKEENEFPILQPTSENGTKEISYSDADQPDDPAQNPNALPFTSSQPEGE